jgi:hypothetical protein
MVTGCMLELKCGVNVMSRLASGRSQCRTRRRSPHDDRIAFRHDGVISQINDGKEEAKKGGDLSAWVDRHPPWHPFLNVDRLQVPD